MVDERLGKQLLATMREALSNVARHADAGRVTVDVEAGPEIVLRITDDGRGLPAERRDGLGLRNMASRAEALGGRFDARQGDRGGTVMEWTVPPTG
jgi:signal transduction histidine kinase